MHTSVLYLYSHLEPYDLMHPFDLATPGGIAKTQEIFKYEAPYWCRVVLMREILQDGIEMA